MGTTTKTKAVGVIRVSTARQADEDHFGPEAQLAAIMKLVRQYDLDLIETISYNDVSGADVMYAPEMQRLLRLIEPPDVGAVVACEFSRLMRPGFEDYPLLAKFVQANITLYLPSGPIKLADAHGQFFATMHGAMASLERHTIKSRLMGGREEARKLGYAAAGGRTIPTGVLWDAKTKTWSHDPVYAPKIAEAFRMVASGETNFQFIIDKLHLHLRPAKGAPKLATPTSLRRLLENRLFIGWREITMKFDLATPKDQLIYYDKAGRMHKRNPPLIAREPDEVIRAQVIAEPLVPFEVFEKVQSVLRAKTDKRHQQHALHSSRPKFAYRGLLFCTCGAPLYSVSGKYQFYRCRDNFPHRGGERKCQAPSMQRARLDAALDQFFPEFGRSYFFVELHKKHGGSEAQRHAALRRQELDSQHKALEAKRQRIVEHCIEGVITKQDRDRRMKAVDAEVESIKTALSELPDAVTLPTYREWQELFRPFRRGFTGLPIAEKFRLVSSRFQGITVADYKAVSLYLLTGESVTPKPVPVETDDGTMCYSCGRELREREKLNPRVNYCERCEDGIASEREAEREEEQVHAGVLDLASQWVPGSNDTSHGL